MDQNTPKRFPASRLNLRPVGAKENNMEDAVRRDKIVGNLKPLIEAGVSVDSSYNVSEDTLRLWIRERSNLFEGIVSLDKLTVLFGSLNAFRERFGLSPIAGPTEETKEKVREARKIRETILMPLRELILAAMAENPKFELSYVTLNEIVMKNQGKFPPGIVSSKEVLQYFKERDKDIGSLNLLASRLKIPNLRVRKFL